MNAFQGAYSHFSAATAFGEVQVWAHAGLGLGIVTKGGKANRKTSNSNFNTSHKCFSF